mgnify:CR=1 FL=1
MKRPPRILHGRREQLLSRLKSQRTHEPVVERVLEDVENWHGRKAEAVHEDRLVLALEVVNDNERKRHSAQHSK